VKHLGSEVEFISLERELKECVLWFGPLRSAARRATILPSGLSLSAEESSSIPPVVAPREYLFDPDPAVVRANLAGKLAEELDIAPIDFTVALFTGSELISSPLVTAYKVELAERFHATRLRAYLREQGIGRVTVVKRGSMIDADELRRDLKLKGKGHRDVVLTSVSGEQTMIVGTRWKCGPDGKATE
jgi:hypothetical protein